MFPFINGFSRLLVLKNMFYRTLKVQGTWWATQRVRTGQGIDRGSSWAGSQASISTTTKVLFLFPVVFIGLPDKILFAERILLL